MHVRPVPLDGRWRDAAGMTLLEAMIATMILGLVLASVLAVAAHSYRYISDLRRSATSSQMLQQKMEDIRLLTWSEVQALSSTFSNTNYPWFAGAVSQSAYDSYGSTTTVVELTLSVTWTNRSGRVLTNTLTTLVSNGGLNKYIF
jgi:Tfp pilus assembly protein PilV